MPHFKAAKIHFRYWSEREVTAHFIPCRKIAFFLTKWQESKDRMEKVAVFFGGKDSFIIRVFYTQHLCGKKASREQRTFVITFADRAGADGTDEAESSLARALIPARWAGCNLALENSTKILTLQARSQLG